MVAGMARGDEPINLMPGNAPPGGTPVQPGAYLYLVGGGGGEGRNGSLGSSA